MKNKAVAKFFAIAMAASVSLGSVPAMTAFAAEATGTNAAASDTNTAADSNTKAIGSNTVSIGGVTYYYVNTAGDNAQTAYTFTVTKGRGENRTSTDYSMTKAELTQIGDTDYYYVAQPGSTALSGTLYGYTGSGTAATYKSVYKEKAGLDVDSSYDAITSATNYTSHHAKDIPSLITYTTDASGNKAISGLALGRSTTSVDAREYVEDTILKAAGATLTSAQEETAAVVLKQNPTAAPAASTVAVKTKEATYTTDSKYGTGEFDIVPDDTVSGYVWSEYWDSVYGATISDGTTTVPAVHWIDMYGEMATSGYHYNKLQIALNNGTSVAANQATVNRYAAFYNSNTGNLTAGKYTITVYADGYSDLTAEAEVPGARLADKTAVYTGQPVEIDAAALYGNTGAVTYTYYSDEACTQALSGAPTEIGTYYVKADVAADADHEATVSNTARLEITAAAPAKKQSQKVTVSTKSKNYKAKALKKGAKTFKISAKTTGDGKITFAKTSGDSKITVTKAGKVTVKKTLKKGTYKLKVKATAAATDTYQKGVKNATITIRVK